MAVPLNPALRAKSLDSTNEHDLPSISASYDYIGNYIRERKELIAFDFTCLPAELPPRCDTFKSNLQQPKTCSLDNSPFPINPAQAQDQNSIAIYRSSGTNSFRKRPPTVWRKTEEYLKNMTG
jgi:hypothetical protein